MAKSRIADALEILLENANLRDPGKEDQIREAIKEARGETVEDKEIDAPDSAKSATAPKQGGK